MRTESERAGNASPLAMATMPSDRVPTSGCPSRVDDGRLASRLGVYRMLVAQHDDRPPSCAVAAVGYVQGVVGEGDRGRPRFDGADDHDAASASPSTPGRQRDRAPPWIRTTRAGKALAAAGSVMVSTLPSNCQRTGWPESSATSAEPGDGRTPSMLTVVAPTSARRMANRSPPFVVYLTGMPSRDVPPHTIQGRVP